MVWTPLLEGQLAADATQAVRAIALDLAAAPADGAAHANERTLFWAYATHLIDEPFAHAAYDAAMDDLIATLQHGVTHAALFAGGLAGIGWTCSHVLDGGAEDVLSIIDEAMLSVLDVERWTQSHDLVQGLTGFGVYFLERLANNPNAALARDGLELVVAHLARNAQRGDHGATWLTTLGVLPPHYHAEFPDGCYDLGLAHGVPGMHALLARAARVLDDDHVRRLAAESLHWLALHRGPAGFPSMVPPAFARGSDPRIVQRGTRTAWCYGDPGVAAALWTAAPELARSLALDCARRDEAATGCRDAGLCHGTAGLAHLLNRFYQASGDRALADSARTWFARTLELPREARHDLIEGNIGIALALIGAVSTSAPSWDRILLADLA